MLTNISKGHQDVAITALKVKTDIISFLTDYFLHILKPVCISVLFFFPFHCIFSISTLAEA